MPRPVIVVVDDAADRLAALEHELDDRYGRQYDVRGAATPAQATACFEELAVAGAEIAVLLVALPLLSAEGADCWMRPGDCTPIRSVRSSSAGATPATGSSAMRSSTRSRAVASTTTCSNRRGILTSCSITRSPACCSTGRRPSAPRRSPSTSSASRGPVGRTSCGTCSDDARCPTRSGWPTPSTGGRSSPEPVPTASCPSSCCPTARCCATRATPSSPRRPDRR